MKWNLVSQWKNCSRSLRCYLVMSPQRVSFLLRYQCHLTHPTLHMWHSQWRRINFSINECFFFFLGSLFIAVAQYCLVIQRGILTPVWKYNCVSVKNTAVWLTVGYGWFVEHIARKYTQKHSMHLYNVSVELNWYKYFSGSVLMGVFFAHCLFCVYCALRLV